MLVQVVGDIRRTAWVDPANQDVLKAIRQESIFEFWRTPCIGIGMLASVVMAMMLGIYMGGPDSVRLPYLVALTTICAVALIICVAIHQYTLSRFRQGIQAFKRALQNGDALDTSSAAYYMLWSQFFLVCGKPLADLINADKDGMLYRTYIRRYVLDTQPIVAALKSATGSERLRLCSELGALALPVTDELLRIEVVAQQTVGFVRDQLAHLLKQQQKLASEE